MKLHTDPRTTQYRVSGYDDGRVRINETDFDQTVLVAPDRLESELPYRNITSIDDDFRSLVAAWAPEILILGTGTKQVFPTREQFPDFARLRVGVEFMTTPAACRTYNILAGESRKVAALLILNADR